LGYVKFTGAGGAQEIRPEGKKVFLSEHVDDLEAALGLSVKIGKNGLIQAIAEKNQGREHRRTECLFNSELDVNKEQCKWCRSNRICSIREGDEFTGRIEIQMIDVADSDQKLLRGVLENQLFNYESGFEFRGGWASENLSSFLFNSKSPFVFSESSEFKKKMIIQPLHHDRLIQPISGKTSSQTSKFPFSPKLAYSPTLRRYLTIFELQILNALWKGRTRDVRYREGPPTCRDFFRVVMEEAGSGFRLKREIEFRVREESGSPDHIGLLMKRGGEMIMSVWNDWEEGVEVDFFEGWGRADYEDPLGRIKQESLRFLEDLSRSMLDSEGKFNEILDDVKFIESRSNGIIFQRERNVIPNSAHIGSRILREIYLEGLTDNYVLIDGENYHASARTPFSIPHENLNAEYYFDAQKQVFSIADSPGNTDVLKILNSEISKRRDDATIFDSREITSIAKDGEKGYLLFDVFEYQSAGHFHDCARKQQLSSDYKDLLGFFNYLRSIGERGTKSEDNRIKNLGEEFLEKVRPELLAREPDPLKIIESITRQESGKFREFVKFERIDDPLSPFMTEIVKFVDHSGAEKNTIEFMRKIEKTDSEFRISASDVRGKQKRRNFKISSDIKKFDWPRSVRLYLQNCLSSESHRKIEETPIIGALYLSSAVRNKVYESPITAREVVKLLRERAYFSTLFIAMEYEKEHYSHMKDLGRIRLKSGGGSEEDMIFWNTCRSPIESRNRMFVEVH